MQKNTTTHRRRAARGLTAFGVAVTAAAGVLFAATPAHAALLQPALYSDRVEFLGNENNANVSGPVKFTIYSNGDWNIYSRTRNGRPAFRNVHWTCAIVIKENSTTTTTKVFTNTVKIKSKQSHVFDKSGTSTIFALQYDTIINPALTQAHCDIHFG